MGKVDLLIDSAGVDLDRSLRKMPLDSWHRVVEVNLTGVFNCCKCALSESHQFRLESS